MAGSVGRLGPFNPEHDDWTLYSERVDFYFIANGITGADKKRATFLSLIGADTYKTLRCLLVPEAPTDKSYEELKKLEDHFAPKRSQIYYRSEFYRSIRKPNISVAEYMSRLRSLAKDCGFGAQLDVMLRDRLICGINDAAIQKRLLSEGDDLTLKDALQHATSLELAMKDSKELHSDPVHSTRAGAEGRHQKPHNHNHTAGGGGKRNCYRCGQSGHAPDKCRYKTATCFNCNKLDISVLFAVAIHDVLPLHAQVTTRRLIVLYTIFTLVILPILAMSTPSRSERVVRIPLSLMFSWMMFQ